MTQEFTLGLRRALPLDSCTFNKSAEIQLLRPLLRRGARQLSRTGNYLSPRQGGNRSFREKAHARTHRSPALAAVAL